MSYIQLSKNIYDCKVCNTRCDGVSVKQFDFEKDVQFSERIENDVIAYYNATYPHICASKCTLDGYPDIQIILKNDETKTPISYVEIKGQARTFMSISKILPQSLLQASETLALNLSDLERYFGIEEKIQVPINIAWCLLSRPCIVGNSSLFFHQNVSVLKKIRTDDSKNTRSYKRASGKGDIVHGIHKGVLVNYHFSINELYEGLPSI